MWNGYLYSEMNVDFQKKRKEKKREILCPEKKKDVEYKNKICYLALDDMLDHKHSACTNAIHS